MVVELHTSDVSLRGCFLAVGGRSLDTISEENCPLPGRSTRAQENQMDVVQQLRLSRVNANLD